MQTISKYVGWLWVTKLFLGSPWKLSVTSPFVELEVLEDSLIIELFSKKRYFLLLALIYWFALLFKLPEKYTIPIKQIESIKKIPSLLASGVQINHHAKAPTYIIFWSFLTKKIMEILEEKGIKVQMK